MKVSGGNLLRVTSVTQFRKLKIFSTFDLEKLNHIHSEAVKQSVP